MPYLSFDHREDLGHNRSTFWFKPDEAFFYTAGQFTELHLPHDGIDARGSQRYFTLSSSPTEPLVGITTKLMPADGSSFKRRLLVLQPGDHVKADEPMGDFVLPKDKTLPVVLVAAGIGVTPARSIVKWLVDTGEERHVTFIQAAGNPEVLLFQELWPHYPLAYTSLVKRPAAGYTGAAGSLTAGFILETAPLETRNLYYLSGPERLVEQLTGDMVTAGVPAFRVITDYFHGYGS